MIDQITAAIDNAARAASVVATAELRGRAAESGWSDSAARSLRVRYSDHSWSVQSSSTEAENLEYGDGETVPSPAVRQFANRTEKLEETFLSILEKRIKGVYL